MEDNHKCGVFAQEVKSFQDMNGKLHKYEKDAEIASSLKMLEEGINQCTNHDDHYVDVKEFAELIATQPLLQDAVTTLAGHKYKKK